MNNSCCCGCVSVCDEISRAFRNFFSDPCCNRSRSRCCQRERCCNSWRDGFGEGFTDGWNARGYNGNGGYGCGCSRSGWQNGRSCNCGSYNNGSYNNSSYNNGAYYNGSYSNGYSDLSAFTDCGNYDSYYACQYKLSSRGSCCSL